MDDELAWAIPVVEARLGGGAAGWRCEGRGRCVLVSTRAASPPSTSSPRLSPLFSPRLRFCRPDARVQSKLYFAVVGSPELLRFSPLAEAGVCFSVDAELARAQACRVKAAIRPTHLV